MICMTRLASRLGNDGKMSWDPLVKFHGTEYLYPRIPTLMFYLVVMHIRCKTLHLHKDDVWSMNAMFSLSYAATPFAFFNDVVSFSDPVNLEFSKQGF